MNDQPEEQPDASADASASVVVKPAEKPGPGTKAAGSKPQRKPSDRVAVLTKEIDTLTHTKHKTAAEIERDTAKATALRAEVAELERKKSALTGAPHAPAADAGGTTAAGAPAAKTDPEPAHPKYRDFATDEDYETAAAKWSTDHRAWSDRRLEALKHEITDGVEARFTSADRDLAQRAAMSTLSTTLAKVAQSIPDWQARRDAVAGLTSAWHNPEAHGPTNTTPFLSDLSMTLLMQGHEEGAYLLSWLAEDLDRAQRIADLRPSRPLRDALVNAPSVTPLLSFFATDEGLEQWNALKQMHPIQMMQAVGALSVRLQPAPRGSGQAAHPITQARPSARPPAGTPGARAASPPAGPGGAPPGDFLDWMAAEDVREAAEKRRQLGLPA